MPYFTKTTLTFHCFEAQHQILAPATISCSSSKKHNFYLGQFTLNVSWGWESTTTKTRLVMHPLVNSKHHISLSALWAGYFCAFLCDFCGFYRDKDATLSGSIEVHVGHWVLRCVSCKLLAFSENFLRVLCSRNSLRTSIGCRRMQALLTAQKIFSEIAFARKRSHETKINS